MNFIKKLLGFPQPDPVVVLQSISINDIDIKLKTRFIEEYSAIAFEKQVDFSDFLKEYESTHINVQDGVIQFDSEVFEIQIIGSYAYEAETWLWAWANTQSNFNSNSLQQALDLKKFGEIEHFELLSQPKIEMPNSELHVLAMIALGMFDADAYYMVDYGQGLLLITLTDNRIKQFRNNDASRVFSVFPQVISQFDMNHKDGLNHYLSKKGFSIQIIEDNMTAQKEDMGLQASFDEFARLTALNNQ